MSCQFAVVPFDVLPICCGPVWCPANLLWSRLVSCQFVVVPFGVLSICCGPVCCILFYYCVCCRCNFVLLLCSLLLHFVLLLCLQRQLLSHTPKVYCCILLGCVCCCYIAFIVAKFCYIVLFVVFASCYIVFVVDVFFLLLCLLSLCFFLLLLSLLLLHFVLLSATSIVISHPKSDSPLYAVSTSGLQWEWVTYMFGFLPFSVLFVLKWRSVYFLCTCRT